MIGDKLKKLRKQNGIYQKDLAEALSVSKSTVAMCETGNRMPDIETVKRIADYFGVTVEYLIGGSELDHSKEVSENDIKFALFHGAEGITDEMYAEVKQFAEMVKLREENKRKDKK